MKLNLQSIFCTLYYRSQRKCYFLLGFKKKNLWGDNNLPAVLLQMFCASGVLCPCFLQEFHHTCQADLRCLCTSFLKGARSHFSHSPCYFPVLSSCSVFSAAFLLLAVWWLDQKAIFVPWVEDCCQEVQRLGVYAVKPLLHSLQQCNVSFCLLHAAICTKTLVQ